MGVRRIYINVSTSVCVCVRVQSCAELDDSSGWASLFLRIHEYFPRTPWGFIVIILPFLSFSFFYYLAYLPVFHPSLLWLLHSLFCVAFPPARDVFCELLSFSWSHEVDDTVPVINASGLDICQSFGGFLKKNCLRIICLARSVQHDVFYLFIFSGRVTNGACIKKKDIALLLLGGCSPLQYSSLVYFE